MTTTQQRPSDIQAGSPDPETDDLDLRSFVTFSRNHSDDAQQRQVVVRLDNAPGSTLMFGDRVTVEVTAGHHLMRANNTLFWKRESFSIEPGEHIEFVFINRPGRMMLGLLAVIGVAPLYLDIIRRSVR